MVKRQGLKLLLGTAVLATGCVDVVDSETIERRIDGDVISDDKVLEWNEFSPARFAALSPPTGQRWQAMLQLAVFEAVNTIRPRYEPYYGTLTAPEGADPEAAAVQAAAAIMLAALPAQAAVINAQLATSLASIPDSQAKTDGIAVGAAAAALVIADRTGDGITPPVFWTVPNADPGEWQTTSACPIVGGVRVGVAVNIASLRPFAIPSADAFDPGPPPDMTSEAYAIAFNEVKSLGDLNSTTRSPEARNMALLYQAALGNVVWMTAFRAGANSVDDDIVTTARNAAIVAMAMNDANIGLIHAKYEYTFWRPETAIPRAAEDGNDATEASAFTPLFPTPCHPSYISGHGAVSSAAAKLVKKFYGNDGYTFSVSHPSVPGFVLSYDGPSQLLEDIHDARIYGGIHFRFDQEASRDLGNDTANYTNNHLLGRL